MSFARQTMSITVDDVAHLDASTIRAEQIAAVAAILAHARDRFETILRANTSVASTVGVAGSILQRVTECGESIELLCRHSRFRDAAVLIVSLMELRLDIQYIAQSAAREATWLKHSNEWRKPWKIDDVIDAVYAEPKDRDAQKEMHHAWCLVKHSSPAKKAPLDANASTVRTHNMAFSITCDGMRLLLQPDNLEHMSTPLLFAVGCDVRDVCYAAGSIVARHGVQMAAADMILEPLARIHSKAHEKAIMWKLVQLRIPVKSATHSDFGRTLIPVISDTIGA